MRVATDADALLLAPLGTHRNLMIDPTGTRAVAGEGMGTVLTVVDLGTGVTTDGGYGVDNRTCTVVGWLDAADVQTSCWDDTDAAGYWNSQTPEAQHPGLWRLALDGRVATLQLTLAAGGDPAPLPWTGTWVRDDAVAFPGAPIDQGDCSVGVYTFESGTSTELAGRRPRCGRLLHRLEREWRSLRVQLAGVRRRSRRGRAERAPGGRLVRGAGSGAQPTRGWAGVDAGPGVVGGRPPARLSCRGRTSSPPWSTGQADDLGCRSRSSTPTFQDPSSVLVGDVGGTYPEMRATTCERTLGDAARAAGPRAVQPSRRPRDARVRFVGRRAGPRARGAHRGPSPAVLDSPRSRRPSSTCGAPS